MTETPVPCGVTGGKEDVPMGAQTPSAGRTRRIGADGVSTAMRSETAPSQTLVLEGYPTPAQASLLGPNTGTRRHAVDKARSAIHDLVKIQVAVQGVGAVPPPARATYTFVVPDRGRRDWDNYALMCKPVQDGLVRAGVLPGGDHFAALEGNVRFRVENGRRALVVTVEEAA